MQASQCLLPVESHRTCLIFPVKSCDNVWEMLSTREAHPGGFIGARSHRHPLFNTYQKSRHPEGKHGFRLNFMYLFWNVNIYMQNTYNFA